MKKNNFMKHTEGFPDTDLDPKFPVDVDLTKDFNEIVSGKSKKIKPYDIDLTMI